MNFTPLPREYIASTIRRENETLGVHLKAKEEFELYNIYRNPRAPGKYYDAPKILFPEFFVKHGVTQEVLYMHTLYPLAAVLGRIKADCKYTPRTYWKICLLCIKDDIQHYGAAYMHVDHIFRHVSVCAKHATQLYERCPTCNKTIIQHKIFEFSKCYTKYPAEQKNEGSPRHLYSRFISDLLNYRGENLGKVLPDVIIHRVREKNFPNEKRKNMHELNQEAEDKLGIEKTDKWVYQLDMGLMSAHAFLACSDAQEYLEHAHRLSSLHNPEKSIHAIAGVN